MKGSSQIWWTLALILIPLVVLVIAGLGEQSLLEELKTVAKGLDQFLPDIERGLPELKAGEVSIPVEHKVAIKDLKKIILSLKDKENCFANYGQLPDLGEKGTTLSFIDDGTETYIDVKGGTGGKNVVIHEVLAKEEEFFPCVIAGNHNQAENFYRKIMAGEEIGDAGFFLSVSNVEIKYGGSNIISFSDSGKKITTELKDNGWLYTPDGYHFCFLPTHNYVFGTFGKEGLDEQVFAPNQGLTKLHAEGRLPLCKEEQIVTIEYVDGQSEQVKFKYGGQVWLFQAQGQSWQRVDVPHLFIHEEFKTILGDLQLKNEAEGIHNFAEVLLPSPWKIQSVEGLTLLDNPLPLPLLIIDPTNDWIFIYDRYYQTWLVKVRDGDWQQVTADNELAALNEEQGEEYLQQVIDDAEIIPR